MGQRLSQSGSASPIQADEALQIECEAAGWHTNEIRGFLEAMSMMSLLGPDKKALGFASFENFKSPFKF